MTKQENLVPCRERTLLIISLTSLRDPIGVPTFPGQKIRLPPIVVRLKLGSSFCGKCFANHRCVGYLFSKFGGDSVIVNGMEGVGA